MTNTITRTVALFAAAAFVAGASMPALAADPTAKSADVKPAKERRYCVEQITTGSMLKKPRVCKTRDEWIAETGIDPSRK